MSLFPFCGQRPLLLDPVVVITNGVPNQHKQAPLQGYQTLSHDQQYLPGHEVPLDVLCPQKSLRSQQLINAAKIIAAHGISAVVHLNDPWQKHAHWTAAAMAGTRIVSALFYEPLEHVLSRGNENEAIQAAVHYGILFKGTQEFSGALGQLSRRQLENGIAQLEQRLLKSPMRQEDAKVTTQLIRRFLAPALGFTAGNSKVFLHSRQPYDVILNLQNPRQSLDKITRFLSARRQSVLTQASRQFTANSRCELCRKAQNSELLCGSCLDIALHLAGSNLQALPPIPAPFAGIAWLAGLPADLVGQLDVATQQQLGGFLQSLPNEPDFLRPSIIANLALLPPASCKDLGRIFAQVDPADFAAFFVNALRNTPAPSTTEAGPTPEVDLAEIEFSLKTGDIVLAQSFENGDLEAVMRLLTRSAYTKVGIVVRNPPNEILELYGLKPKDGTQAGSYVLTAEAGTVETAVLSPFADFVLRHRYVSLRQYTRNVSEEPAPEFSVTLGDLIRSLHGFTTHVSVPELLQAWFGQTEPDDNQLQSNVVVGLALKALEFADPNTLFARTPPGFFSAKFDALAHLVKSGITYSPEVRVHQARVSSFLPIPVPPPLNEDDGPCPDGSACLGDTWFEDHGYGKDWLKTLDSDSADK